MKTIALWSRDHIVAARLLIALCRILMFALACFISAGLQKNQFNIYPAVFWVFAALFLLIHFLYSRSYASFSFYKRKLLDGLIVVSAFMMVIGFVSQKGIGNFIFYKSLNGSFTIKKDKGTVQQSLPTFKELKKQFRELRMMAKKREGASAGGIILAILVAAGLGILLAAAACSLSCNGQDALAVITLVTGVAAIFFITRLILRGTRKKNMALDTGK